MPKHLSVTQASVTSLFTAAVGVVVSVVTPLSGEKQAIVAAGGVVIAAVFAVIHLVEAIHASKVKITLADLESGIREVAQEEVAKVPVQRVAEDVIRAHGLSDIGSLVKAELDRILVATGLEQAKVAAQAAAVTPAAPADPNVPAVPPAA